MLDNSAGKLPFFHAKIKVMTLRGTAFRRRPTSSFKAPSKRLSIAGHSDTTEVKRNIRELLREGATRRDAGCHPQLGLYMDAARTHPPSR